MVILYHCNSNPVEFEVYIRLLSALPNHPTIGDYFILFSEVLRTSKGESRCSLSDFIQSKNHFFLSSTFSYICISLQLLTNHGSNYIIDSLFLPGKKNGPGGLWDIVGILGTIPATVSCMLGVFAAHVLQSKKMDDKKRLIWLIGGGLVMVVIGYLWGIQFPIIKKVWTSTYVLVAGGYSLMLIGIFYYLIDVKGYNKWTPIFVWIGVNPITIYMLRNLIDFGGISKKLVGGDLAILAGEQWAYLLVNVISLGLSLLLLKFMYDRKIFLKA